MRIGKSCRFRSTRSNSASRRPKHGGGDMRLPGVGERSGDVGQGRPDFMPGAAAEVPRDRVTSEDQRLVRPPELRVQGCQLVASHRGGVLDLEWCARVERLLEQHERLVGLGRCQRGSQRGQGAGDAARLAEGLGVIDDLPDACHVVVFIVQWVGRGESGWRGSSLLRVLPSAARSGRMPCSARSRNAATSLMAAAGPPFHWFSAAASTHGEAAAPSRRSSARASSSERRSRSSISSRVSEEGRARQHDRPQRVVGCRRHLECELAPPFGLESHPRCRPPQGRADQAARGVSVVDRAGPPKHVSYIGPFGDEPVVPMQLVGTLDARVSGLRPCEVVVELPTHARRHRLLVPGGAPLRTGAPFRVVGSACRAVLDWP